MFVLFLQPMLTTVKALFFDVLNSNQQNLLDLNYVCVFTSQFRLDQDFSFLLNFDPEISATKQATDFVSIWYTYFLTTDNAGNHLYADDTQIFLSID